MKVNVIEITVINNKDGEKLHAVKCLANVYKYGSLSLELITVIVSPEKVKNIKLGEQDLDIVLPYSQYSYRLS